MQLINSSKHLDMLFRECNDILNKYFGSHVTKQTTNKIESELNSFFKTHHNKMLNNIVTTVYFNVYAASIMVDFYHSDPFFRKENECVYMNYSHFWMTQENKNTYVCYTCKIEGKLFDNAIYTSTYLSCEDYRNQLITNVLI